jgi:hypothetical protein
LTVVPIDARMRPLKPPARLSAAERRVWRETTRRAKRGWFRGSENMLEMFCRCVCFERRFADWIKELDDPNDPRFRDLVTMHKTEAMLVANLATRLRLTVRSTVDRYTPKLASSGPKPWQDGK